MKPQSAYVASRQAIRMGRAGTPVPERSLAFRLLQEFSQFAERACGCKALSNRAQVRRAVFHTTQSIDWDAFVEKRLQKDLSSIESIARMECPVTLPDKTMLALKVPESAPKRIIFAGKVLRKHLALTETLTCRGCHKRSRCRWFKAPPDAELTAGVRHVGRLLLGMGQYARAHLQHPETYPWYFNEANLEGARTLMRAIQEHVEEAGGGFFYEDVEFADNITAREALLREARKKEEQRRAAVEERFLSLPQWMRETLQPIPGPGMTARQRKLLEDGPSGEDVLKLEADQKPEDKDWVEEGAPGEALGPVLFDLPPQSRRRAVDVHEAERELVDMDRTEEMPVIKRFHHLSAKPKNISPEANRQRNAVFGTESSGVFRRLGDLQGHRINLDEVPMDQEEMMRWEEIKPDGTSVQQGQLDSLGIQLKGRALGRCRELTCVGRLQELLMQAAENGLKFQPPNTTELQLSSALAVPHLAEALKAVQCVGHTKGKVEENNDARIRLSQDERAEAVRKALVAEGELQPRHCLPGLRPVEGLLAGSLCLDPRLSAPSDLSALLEILQGAQSQVLVLLEQKGEEEACGARLSPSEERWWAEGGPGYERARERSRGEEEIERDLELEEAEEVLPGIRRPVPLEGESQAEAWARKGRSLEVLSDLD
ncbi:unnamed protein product [Effrenium voratum]|nr:unnamed protein product [Effrenium voratum]